MKSNQLACVLSMAGTDPSGGAGINADIKTISATGSYATSVITALVAQNTQGVQRIEPVSADFVQAQLQSLLDDLTIHAVKIGMLHDERIIDVIGHRLKQFKPSPIVFDPVMVAKDGSPLLKLDTITLLKERILRQVYLITPNLFETEHLLGQSISNENEMEAAATALGKAYAINVLIKGGHLTTDLSSDVLYRLQDNTCHWFHEKRIRTKNTHGTGCTLSSAIASYLAQGQPLLEAINSAKQYLTQAILAGQHYKIGKGNGPVDHFYFFDNRKRLLD